MYFPNVFLSIFISQWLWCYLIADKFIVAATKITIQISHWIFKNHFISISLNIHHIIPYLYFVLSANFCKTNRLWEIWWSSSWGYSWSVGIKIKFTQNLSINFENWTRGRADTKSLLWVYFVRFLQRTHNIVFNDSHTNFCSNELIPTNFQTQTQMDRVIATLLIYK